MNLNFTSKDKQKNSNYPNFLNNFLIIRLCTCYIRNY